MGDAEALREAIEDFITRAAHDLREPLRAIRLGARLMSDAAGSETNEKAASGARFINDGADRLDILIRDIAAYCHEEVREPAFEQTDTDLALFEAKNELSRELKASGATVSHDLLPTLAVDTAAITAVFRALLSNACKFRREDPPRIHVAARQEAGRWVFSVQDNGMGFETAYSERIFRAFEKLNGKEFAGTGLGLTTARKIVERHGGRIWAESVEGEGSTFFFSFPDE